MFAWGFAPLTARKAAHVRDVGFPGEQEFRTLLQPHDGMAVDRVVFQELRVLAVPGGISVTSVNRATS
jgi:hypothetical protein